MTRWDRQPRPAEAGHNAAPVGRDRQPAGHDLPDAILDLQRDAGNGAVAVLLQRDPKGQAAAASATRDEIAAAEAWVTYVALRGNSPQPQQAVPDRFKPLIDVLQLAVGGGALSGIPVAGDVLDAVTITRSRELLKELRAAHRSVTPRADSQAFDLADLALERAQANLSGGPDALPGGATQLDFGQIVNAIRSEADSTIQEAKDAGYNIPPPLESVAKTAAAMYEDAQAGWTQHAPSPTKLTTPADEVGLVELMKEAREAIGDMKARLAADMARARRKEAEELSAAADKQLVELHAMLAERRRQAFASGATGELQKVHDAVGEVERAIDDTKHAAKLMTDKVDRLNAIVSTLGKKGGPLINLPKLPKGITDVVSQLKKANEKLATVIKLLDLVGPAKTDLEGGMKYLEGAEMAIEHFGAGSANPFVSGYVKYYLGPGIKNCMASIHKISETMSSEDRSSIEQGWTGNVAWGNMPGGRAVYDYLRALFRKGAGVDISDDALGYFQTHHKDLSAAVGEDLPDSRGDIERWALRNRQVVWEAFYGAAKPGQ